MVCTRCPLSVSLSLSLSLPPSLPPSLAPSLPRSLSARVVYLAGHVLGGVLHEDGRVRVRPGGREREAQAADRGRVRVRPGKGEKERGLVMRQEGVSLEEGGALFRTSFALPSYFFHRIISPTPVPSFLSVGRGVPTIALTWISHGILFDPISLTRTSSQFCPSHLNILPNLSLSLGHLPRSYLSHLDIFSDSISLTWTSSQIYLPHLDILPNLSRPLGHVPRSDPPPLDLLSGPDWRP